MGAAASTVKEELAASAAASADKVAPEPTPLVANLCDAELDEFVQRTHFTWEEVVALHMHFEIMHAGKRADKLIDCREFQEALGFAAHESLYVDRIFQLFDTNNDEFISFEEFLQSLSTLSSKGIFEEKLRFSFDVLDTDRDGRLSKDELSSMLEACAKDTNLHIPADCLATIIDHTMTEADLDRDGYISFDEYRVLAQDNPLMLNHITLNISGLIAEYMPALHAMAAANRIPST